MANDILQYLMSIGNNFGVPQGDVKNAQGQVVFPTNSLERLLQSSAAPTNEFAASFIGPGKSPKRLQSAPVVKINGETFLADTHEGALERAAMNRRMGESVNDLVDGLGGWNKVRDNHFGYLDMNDEFVPLKNALKR